MTTYTLQDVRDAIERVDDMLRTIGFAANAGACQCTRCAKAHAAPAPAAGASAPSPLSGGQTVDKPAPAPRAPQPGGMAVVLPHGMAKRAALAALASDQIEF